MSSIECNHLVRQMMTITMNKFLLSILKQNEKPLTKDSCFDFERERERERERGKGKCIHINVY